jgi:hypothetical protein
MDFVVVIGVRQQFGDAESALEADAPYQGPAKDYEFLTPDVDRQAEAVMLFQSLGVTYDKNLLSVNDQAVSGGIPRGTEVVMTPDGLLEELPIWNANVLLIGRGALRDPGPNVLHIEARDPSGGTDEHLDSFIIDNLVILYKTRPDKSGLEPRQPTASS